MVRAASCTWQTGGSVFSINPDRLNVARRGALKVVIFADIRWRSKLNPNAALGDLTTRRTRRSDMREYTAAVRNHCLDEWRPHPKQLPMQSRRIRAISNRFADAAIADAPSIA